MSLRSPITNVFDWVKSSSSVVAWPISPVTGGANSFLPAAPGTELISAANFSEDCYGMLITLNGAWVSGAARQSAVRIYVGGNLFIDSLLCAGPQVTPYYFPVFIPKGQSISATAAQNAAHAVGVHIKLLGRPSRPDMLWCGTAVDTFGTKGTNLFEGQAVASGATWISLGVTTKRHGYFEVGFSLSDVGLQDGNMMIDLAYGDATTKQLIISDLLYGRESTEDTSKTCNPFEGFADVPTGVSIYARNQQSSADTGPTMLAYGVVW